MKKTKLIRVSKELDEVLREFAKKHNRKIVAESEELARRLKNGKKPLDF